MTTRRERASVFFFAVIMVLSMVAGSVAFGGPVAADGSTEIEADNSVVGTQPIETESGDEPYATTDSDVTSVEIEHDPNSGSSTGGFSFVAEKLNIAPVNDSDVITVGGGINRTFEIANSTGDVVTVEPEPGEPKIDAEEIEFDIYDPEGTLDDSPKLWVEPSGSDDEVPLNVSVTGDTGMFSSGVPGRETEPSEPFDEYEIRLIDANDTVIDSTDKRLIGIGYNIGNGIEQNSTSGVVKFTVPRENLNNGTDADWVAGFSLENTTVEIPNEAGAEEFVFTVNVSDIPNGEYTYRLELFNRTELPEYSGFDDRVINIFGVNEVVIDTDSGQTSGPVVNTTASSVSPNTVTNAESQIYDVTVTVENTSLTADDTGEVDVRFEEFGFGSEDGTSEPKDDLTIAYTGDNVTDGNLTVSTNVTATAPSTVGERAVTVTDLRRDAGSDGVEYLIEDANIIIDTIEVTEPETVSITGQLNQSNGDPAAEHSVFVSARSGKLSTGTRTNEDGTFSVEVPEGAVYDLTYVQDGGDEGSFPNDGNVDLQNLATVDLRIDPDDPYTSDGSRVNTTDPSLGPIDLAVGNRLDVNVTDESGDPVENALVRYRDAAAGNFSGVGVGTRTNSDGLATLSEREESGLEMNGSTEVAVAPVPEPRFKPGEYVRTPTVDSGTTVDVTLEERQRSATVNKSTASGDSDTYASIQDAVDNTTEDALIVVENGTYDETVNVTHSAALVSASAYESPEETTGAREDAAVLDGGGERTVAFYLENGVDDVSVKGFDVRNYEAGIGTDAGNTTRVAIAENTVGNVTAGIVAERPDGADSHTEWYVRRNVVNAPDGSGIELVDTESAVVLNNVVRGDGEVSASTDDAQNTDVSTTADLSADATEENGTVLGIAVGSTVETRGAFVSGNELHGTYNDTGILAVSAEDGQFRDVNIVNNSLDTAQFQEAGIFAGADGSGELNGISVAENDVNGAESTGAVTVSPIGSGSVVRDIDVTGNELANSTVGVAIIAERDDGFVGDVRVEDNTVSNTDVGVGVASERDLGRIEIERNDISDTEFGIGVETPFEPTTEFDVGIEAVENTVENASIAVGVGGESARANVRRSEIVGNDQGIVSVAGADVDVVDSTVSDTEVGLNATTGSRITAYQTEFSGSDQGVVSTNGADISVVNSTVRNGGAGLTAVNGSRISAFESDLIENDRGVVSTDGSFAFVRTSNVSGNTVGLNASDEGHIIAQQNEIVDNTAFGAAVPDGNATIEATGNWWGAADGPAGGATDPATGTTAAGAGDNVTQNVTFDPWLEGSLVTASGTVFEPDDEPAAGVVTVLTENDGGDSAELDPEGRFVVSAENGSRPMVGYQGQVEGDAISTRDGVADLYTFSPNSTVDGDTELGDFTLPEANVLNVTVVDGNGTPVEGAQVRVRHWEDSHRDGFAFGTGSQTTNGDGELVLRGAEYPGIEVTGDVTVEVQPPEEDTRLADEPREIERTVTENESLGVVLTEAGPTELALEPEFDGINAGDVFTKSVRIDAPENVTSAEFNVTFDSTLLNATDVQTVDNFFDTSELRGTNIDNETGRVSLNVSGVDAASGTGTLAEISFTVRDDAVSSGDEVDTEIAFEDAVVLGETGAQVPLDTRDAWASIFGESTEGTPGGGGSGGEEGDSVDGFSIENVSVPQNATAGRNLTVTATVRNDGDSSETKNVSLAINETSTLRESLTLEPDATETVTFRYTTTEGDIGENRSVSVITPDVSVTRDVDILPPIEAAIAIEQQPVANGEGVFDGSNSVGRNLTYTWVFDDGEPTDPSSDPGIAQPYEEAGTAEVTLIVEDEFGQTDETTRSVTVESGSTDDSTPGFGSLVTLAAVLVSALLMGRRSD